MLFSVPEAKYTICEPKSTRFVFIFRLVKVGRLHGAPSWLGRRASLHGLNRTEKKG